nr:hypothetical protein [Brevibacillus laterosporus]
MKQRIDLIRMKLAQNNTKIILDKDCDQAEVQPEEEPEATYS